MSKPERGWSLVSVEKTPRSFGLDNQVILNETVGLGGILNEDTVAHSIVSHVVLHFEVMHAMDSYSTVVSLVNRIVAHIRLVDGADHVEMDGVSS